MAAIHDYLDDQVRDIEADLRRALKRAENVSGQINPVSEFGTAIRLDLFSVTQTLGDTLRDLAETRGRINEDRKLRPR